MDFWEAVWSALGLRTGLMLTLETANIAYCPASRGAVNGQRHHLTAAQSGFSPQQHQSQGHTVDGTRRLHELSKLPVVVTRTLRYRERDEAHATRRTANHAPTNPSMAPADHRSCMAGC